MEKKRRLTTEEKMQRDIASITEGQKSAYLFKAHGLDKIKKAYTLPFLENTVNYTCNVLISCRKCDQQCDTCEVYKLEQQVMSEIVLGYRRNPIRGIKQCPRHKHASVVMKEENITIGYCAKLMDTISQSVKINQKNLLKVAKPLMKYGRA